MQKESYYKDFIATIPGFPKEGVLFRDITPTLLNPEAFSHVIEDMAEEAAKYDFDKIVCAEARGFVFGAALGLRLQKGIVMARKPGKLPNPGHSYSYSLEYGANTMVLPEGSLKEGERVLILDDLLATGGSAEAMIGLARSYNAIPVAGFFYVELPDFHAKEKLEKDGIPVFSLVRYEGD